MRLLIDNALSPIVSATLSKAGHDCVHVRDRNLESAPDERVFGLAEREERIIVSADTDFGALLALRRQTRPSFVLFRKASELKPTDLATQLLEVLETFAEDLEAGCVLTITDERIRIRRLPID
jgi:predicted nuclease of predicted toxin-antitoxin system